MKKLLLSALVAMSLLGTVASADVAKGQKLYMKKAKTYCKTSGAAIASKHTQDEWDEIGVSGLASEIKVICPKIKDKALKEKYLEHYFDFFKEYASDSGNVPSC